MSLVRRKSMKISPISVVRSSLVVSPVSGVAAIDSTSFSDVLGKALNAPQSNESDDVYQAGSHRHLVRREKAAARIEAETQAQQKQHDVASTAAWSPFSDASADLYTQLETLLREKSLLIAVA